MLTILHRHADGSEELFTAEALVRTNPEQCVPAYGDFIARGVTRDGLPSPDYHFAMEWPFGAVFVMNERGATVARYTNPPIPAEIMAQADPAALAA